MKNIASIFMLIILTLITGCSDDDSSSASGDNTQGAAQGEWHLVQVTGSFAGVNNVFEPGTITWTFNNNGTITVENTNPDPTVEDFFDSGTYQYSYTENNDMQDLCDVVLQAGGIHLGCEDITGDDLTLTQAFADGYTLKFSR